MLVDIAVFLTPIIHLFLTVNEIRSSDIDVGNVVYAVGGLIIVNLHDLLSDNCDDCDRIPQLITIHVSNTHAMEPQNLLLLYLISDLYISRLRRSKD